MDTCAASSMGLVMVSRLMEVVYHTVYLPPFYLFPSQLYVRVVIAFLSLVFWRNQVRVCSVWLPIHSLIFFCLGVLVIERPYMFPAVFFLGVAWFMMANMYLRLIQPSPWYRCLSFWHYFRILLLGKSSYSIEKINENEGWEETKARKAAWKKRIEDDEKALQTREAVDKMIDKIGDDDIQTRNVMSNELLSELGKIQGIVGGAGCCA